jgi:DNA-binding transcriptional MerR regulator/methylmalonyl-CoA mutase cobalamin-binding subunit
MGKPMSEPAQHPPSGLSIAAVERDTGLSKDTLRVWERRYGFPRPDRDAAGERTYPPGQVDKLRLLKRLLDAGHRPGRVVPMSTDELVRLSSAAGAKSDGSTGAGETVPALREYLEVLRSCDVDELRRQLGQAHARTGLGRFVVDLVAPLNTLVGEAWMRGQLEIFEEHLYTEALQAVLREAIGSVPRGVQGDRPRVLLTTFPGEPHGLGLLMAEAVFVLDGARCTSLGVQTPLWDIVLAAAAQRADIVALSFTGCMSPNHVVDGLAELRGKLPAPVEIWAGGSAPVLQRRRVAGVHAVAALPQIHDELRRWRAMHRSGAGGDSLPSSTDR